MEKTNKNYQQVCGGEKSIWFLVEFSDGKRFLQWAKDLGCVWIGGKKINPNKKTQFLTIAMNSDGTIANVPAFCHCVKELKNVKRVNFSDIKT